MTKIYPVIMCGGVGSRLWPLSRKSMPKQFHNLVSDKSMLRETYLRASGAGDLNIAAPSFVCAVDYEAEILAQCAQDNVSPHSLILEPCARNTAAVAAAIALDISQDEDSLILLMPADHHVESPKGFWDAVERGIAAAQQGNLMTFGIKPETPETGFGYIRAGADMGAQVSTVSAFVEKPNLETAQSYVQSGEYFWNGGIFMFRPADMISAFEAHAPDILASCKTAIEKGTRRNSSLFLDAATFADCRSDSIDYAIMETANNVAVIVAQDMGWSDIGSWQAICERALTQAKGEGSSVALGDVYLDDCAQVYARSDGPLIAAIGVTDMVIVATPDAVLITRPDRSQDVKKVVNYLADKKRGELL